MDPEYCSSCHQHPPAKITMPGSCINSMCVVTFFPIQSFSQPDASFYHGVITRRLKKKGTAERKSRLGSLDPVEEKGIAGDGGQHVRNHVSLRRTPRRKQDQFSNREHTCRHRTERINQPQGICSKVSGMRAKKR